MSSNDRSLNQRRHYIGSYCISALVSVLLVGCSLGDLVNGTDLPGNVRDPNAVKTEAGALGLYAKTVITFAMSVGGGYGSTTIDKTVGTMTYYGVLRTSGTLTDELEVLVGSQGFPPNGFEGLLDTRNIDNRTSEQNGPYKALHIVRGLSIEARGALRKYYPAAPEALQGHLFALEGFSEVLLAELYCSGIPLSTIDYESDYSLTRGFSTDEVYEHALSHFDSAGRYAGDSTRIMHFISLGRARALLGLGNVQAAAAAVADVPNGYQYLLTYASNRRKFVPRADAAVQSDREGQNGLAFVSSGDPRTRLPGLMNEMAPLVMASGLEARLIEAEAALIAGRQEWLAQLNALRTTCVTRVGCPTPAPAGLGGIANLPPLDDPALDPLPPGKDTMDVRIDLLFTERAYWLYLTGHRQGDLRRLVRHYHRPQLTVYPTGLWGLLQLVAYGDDVTVPVPREEQVSNQLYDGCVHRDA